MSAALEIWSRIISHKFELRRDGENITLFAPLGGTLPNELFEDLKAHKPELLSLLKYQEEADALLLESTRRIANAWPHGFDLDDDLRWQSMENELHAAYFTEDLDRLRAVIDCRERLALRLFVAHRKERAA